jgi:biopolymer transport protein ExbB
MNWPLFLQTVVTDETHQAAEEAARSQEVTVTLLDLVMMGGWFMIPLAALLVLSIYIFVERYQTIKRVNKDPQQFLKQIQNNVRNGDLNGALALCQSTDTPFARMVAKGISRLGQPIGDITASIEIEAKLELNRLEKSLAYLATISGAAPMIGFLGTVTGMIRAFMTISMLEGNVNPAQLAGGIYEAMITTAVGLIVGIPAYVGYNILVNQVGSVMNKMEVTVASFIDLLQEPAR